MSEDKTYCDCFECKHRACGRHFSHIKHHDIPHSFAFFKDCKHWKPNDKNIKAESDST